MVPCDRSSSPWVPAVAGIVPLCPVSVTGFCGGSGTLDSLGASAIWFCNDIHCHCGVLCGCQQGLVLLLSAVASWFPYLTCWPFGYLTLCRAACPLLPGFPPPLLSSISSLSALQVSVVVPSGYMLRYRVVFSRCGPLPGRVCLSPRPERWLFLHLPGVWLESSRCGHPDGSSLSQISIGTKTLRAPSLEVGAEPSQWGHPYRVVWRISAHSIGTKASSIHLSLVASRWGPPTGRVWFFSRSIATKSSLIICSLFLQDGVTLFGSGSNDLVSSEGIRTVGLL